MTHTIIRNNHWQWLLIITLLGMFNLPVQAAVPDNVDYQGYLTDSSGSPINGTVSIAFSLFNIDSGGIALWSEKYSVTVSNGLFSIQLGGAGSPFPAGLFDDPLWLGIDVTGDGEMTPRIAFSSAAFAHKADDALTLEGQTAASLDQSAHVSDTGNPHSVTAAQAGAVSSVNFSLHIGNASAHHAKTTTFTELTDQASDAQLPVAIARDAEIMPTVLAGDGPGSTLNADLLDGLNSSAFMSSGTDNWVNISGDTMTGNLGVMARVGIGTTTPSFDLHVRGGINNYLAFIDNDNNTSGSGDTVGLLSSGNAYDTGTGSGRGGVFVGSGGSSSGNAYGSWNSAAAYGLSPAYGVYSYATGGTTTGREYAFYGVGDGYFSGKVGIGTPTPGYALEVRGGVSGYLGYFNNDNNASGSALGIYASGDARDTGTGDGSGGTFQAYGGSTSGGAYGTRSYAYAYGTSDAIGVYSNATPGTTTGREYAFYGIGDGYISGDLGISRSDPRTELEVRGDLRLGSDAASCAGNSNNCYGDIRHDGSGGFVINSTTGGAWADMHLQTNGTTRMFIESAGNVGIGITNPTEKLAVSGNIRAAGYKSADGSPGMTTNIWVMGGLAIPCSISVKNGLITATSCPNP